MKLVKIDDTRYVDLERTQILSIEKVDETFELYATLTNGRNIHITTCYSEDYAKDLLARIADELNAAE